MRIGMDVSPLQSGHRMRGIGSYTRGLLAGFAELDMDDQFILFHWSDLPLDLAAVQVPRNHSLVRVWRPRFGRASALAAQQIIEPVLLLKARLDVFHHPGVVADPTAGAPALAWLPRSTVVVHDLAPLHIEELVRGRRVVRAYYWFMLRVIRLARAIFADSATVRDELIQSVRVSSDRVEVVPLAVDPIFSRPTTASQHRAQKAIPYLLHVGGDIANKNLVTVLKAFSLLARRDLSEYNLVIVGPDGPNLRSFRQRETNLTNRVFRFEALSSVELAAVYRDADALLFPSLYEGFGLPVLEAMASGTPVIAGSSGSLAELASGAAILVRPTDVYGLAAATSELVGSRALRAHFTQAGLERAKDFTWRETASRTRRAFERTLRVRPTSRGAL